MLSCKEATQLMSERQDRELALAERLQLRVHLMMCTGCTNFSSQISFLRAACRRYAEQYRGKNDD